jgi:hypothetical protein
MTKYEYILVDMFYKYELYSEKIGMKEFVDEFNKRIEEEEIPKEIAAEFGIEVPEQVGGKGRGRPRKKVDV